MNNLKFEKINMKLVILIAAIVIALLTAIFIIFRTNLIIDHKDNNEKDPVVETPTPENPENPDNPDNPENPENPDKPENPDNPGGGSTENPEDPSIYDDPEEDEDKVSKAAKERTKKAKELTVVEKEYIIQENIEKKVLSSSEMKKNCGGEYFCVFDVEKYVTYSTDKEIGKKIEGCKGKAYVQYVVNGKKKTVEVDFKDVICE